MAAKKKIVTPKVAASKKSSSKYPPSMGRSGMGSAESSTGKKAERAANRTGVKVTGVGVDFGDGSGIQPDFNWVSNKTANRAFKAMDKTRASTLAAANKKAAAKLQVNKKKK